MSARLDEATPKAAGRLTTAEIEQQTAALAAALAEALAVEADAFSLTRFCLRHGISLRMLYKLVNDNLGPQTFTVGTRVLVSREAAARWRAEREATTTAEREAAAREAAAREAANAAE